MISEEKAKLLRQLSSITYELDEKRSEYFNAVKEVEYRQDLINKLESDLKELLSQLNSMEE